MELLEKVVIDRIEEGKLKEIDDDIVKEYPLKIKLNNKLILTIVCSPANIIELATGYLFAEGLLKGSQDIKDIQLEENVINLLTYNKDKINMESMIKKNRDDFIINYDIIFFLIKELFKKSLVFDKTGGVHNALLANKDGSVLVFKEDIGRHNTVDKICGHILLNNIDPKGKILLLSGRISTEILLKAAKSKIAIIASPSATTDKAVKLADKLGITLIAFVRKKRMNIYTHKERVKFNQD